MGQGKEGGVAFDCCRRAADELDLSQTAPADSGLSEVPTPSEQAPGQDKATNK